MTRAEPEREYPTPVTSEGIGGLHPWRREPETGGLTGGLALQAIKSRVLTKVSERLLVLFARFIEKKSEERLVSGVNI